MDFMKVFDQTVREIKREVNLKVLKIPEIEQKVLDATDNEPWGPHGTALSEIAQATKKFTECQMVMNVLWTRLGETGKDWRYVYKALTVIEYLIANGSEQAVDDIVEHTFQISSLTGFEYVEPNGKDMGINVRKKAEKIVALLNDKDKIQEVRNKAASNREKYVGLSSTGMTYKSSSASYSGNSNRYGGFSDRYDSDSYKNKDEDRFGEENVEKFVPKSRQGTSTEARYSQNSSKDRDSTSPSRSSKTKVDEYSAISRQGHGDQIDDVDEDFDPRGTIASKPPTGNSKQVDLFGQSLIGDLLDAPTSIPSQSSATNVESDADLFADADFVSAAPNAADLFADADFVSAAPKAETQGNIDLFEAASGSSTTVASTMDFFASPDPVIPETKSESTGPLYSSSSSNFVDPFAAIPMNNFGGSGDVFGAFTSQTEQPYSGFTQNPVSSATINEMSTKSILEPKVSSKKDAFQVKSGIWADSLSRGLIDLNISAPKKVNLADVGIVGGLGDGSEEKHKGPATSFYMGSSMGSMGSTTGRTGVANPNSTSGDDFFSSFTPSSQYQFGDFQK